MANPSLLSTQIGAAAVCAYLVQLMQRWSKLPWITEHTTGVNTILRVVTSGVAALGVHWAWAESSGGGHTLSIAIPSGAALLGAGWHWFVQYAVQHGWGNLLAVGPGPAPPAPPPAPSASTPPSETRA
jgi:hypothetical protein